MRDIRYSRFSVLAGVTLLLGTAAWAETPTGHEATPAASIHVEAGFRVELLHSATADEGSWISMTKDDKGRFIISPQGRGKHLLRLTLSRGRLSKVEHLDAPVGSAMGLLYVDNGLYADARGPGGWGIYRLEARGDSFGPPVFLRAISESSEHGSHAVILGPDNKLYVVCGNFTPVLPDVLPNSPFWNYAEDQLLPRAEDGRGFGAGLKSPSGYIFRMDRDGRNCQLFAGGTRNTYDMAFNPDGELFGFDSDMEGDWGDSWYRPIRINHWVSGADYGFREGSGKFPEDYEDTLPATLNVGIGSPTGVMFATKSKFPRFYRDACFMEDWAYGRLFAVHFTPDGATYDATIETVLRGIPLNLTALEIGDDGALYFITGGRDTASGLYRLSYTGPPLPEPRRTRDQRAADKQARIARRLRHDLEHFQGRSDPQIVSAVWPCLGSEDRWIRYAARGALESQDPAWWKDRALAETNTEAGLTALLALARRGGAETQRDLIGALRKFPFQTLSQQQEVLKLRVLEVTFCRQGRPEQELARHTADALDALYPADCESVNRDLCELLLYLRAPDAVAKTMALLAKAPTQEEQTYYIMRLRDITNGWTLDLRKEYFGWFKDRPHLPPPPKLMQYFKDAGRDYSDGESFGPYLENFRKEAAATLSANEREELKALLPQETSPSPTLATTRKFVKDWRMTDLLPHLDEVKSGRSYKKGKALYSESQCILCHRFGNTGGAVGPELEAVSSRLAPRDILESILEPSKVLSEQYQNTILTLKNGDILVGRIIQEDDQKVVVMIDPIHETRQEVRKADVVSRRASKISPMPDGLANSLTESEIWDLIAYLESAGKETYAGYHK